MSSSGITIVGERELREIVNLDAEVITAVEAAFNWASEGRAYSPPIMHIAVEEHHGDVDIKSAYIRGQSHFAVKIAAGFFDNPKLGLPSGTALVILINSQTGRPEMIFLDNGYLTDVRTAAAGAIAVKHLARPQDDRIGIIGSGIQARYQLRAISVGRRFKEVRIAARSADKAAAYAEEMSRELKVPVIVASADEVVAASDIVVTTTPSQMPVLQGEFLKPGQTVVAMGSDVPHKRELDARAMERASLIVCDNRKQCEILGELHHALDERALRADTLIVELGEITSGRRRGRASDADIVICDLTGMGAQDSAIGLYTQRKVLANNLGWQPPS